MTQVINILLVDDDEDDFLITQDLLSEIETRSYKLTWCKTFQAALEVLPNKSFDVYLFDYHIGKDSGLDLLKKAIALGIQEPIIMLTGLGDVEVDTQAIQAGAADYLVKGQFSATLLDRSIRHALERMQMQRALRESEQRYAIAAKGANDGLWDWQLESGEVYFSSRWKEMLGFEEQEIGKGIDEWFSRVHPEDKERVEEEIQRHMTAQTPKLELEYRLKAKDGNYRWMLTRGLAVRTGEGKAHRMTGWQTDLTERTASYDALTGLPNRSLFFDRLARAIEHKKWQVDYNFAVLFLDLDSFKVVNDSLGHAAGDELLLEVASRLESCLRTSDTVTRIKDTSSGQSSTVARFGGDEFALLIDNIDSIEIATRVAQRIQESLADPFILGAQHIFSSASIGIALGSERYENVEDLLRDADIAMYRAKQRGKAQHVLFDAEMHHYVKSRLALDTDLRKALERQEFILVYQPVIALDTGAIIGFEALVRWHHASRGLIGPNDFIPLCEETGLIVPLGLWILEQACQQLRKWQLHFPEQKLKMSVNLSSKQLAHPELLEQVQDILIRTKLDAQSLCLEVTESMMLHSASSVVRLLKDLRTLGVCIQIDDFGTGYSSLSRLHSLPLDTLKIDRSFVSHLTKDSESAGIIDAIITLGHTLGLSVVAEGAETLEQVKCLQTLNCNFAQGYLFSPPRDPETITRLLEEKKPFELNDPQAKLLEAKI